MKTVFIALSFFLRCFNFLVCVVCVCALARACVRTCVFVRQELEVLRGEMEHKHVHLQTSGVIPETTADRARKNWSVKTTH